MRSTCETKRFDGTNTRSKALLGQKAWEQDSNNPRYGDVIRELHLAERFHVQCETSYLHFQRFLQSAHCWYYVQQLQPTRTT